MKKIIKEMLPIGILFLVLSIFLTGVVRQFDNIDPFIKSYETIFGSVSQNYSLKKTEATKAVIEQISQAYSVIEVIEIQAPKGVYMVYFTRGNGVKVNLNFTKDFQIEPETEKQVVYVGNNVYQDSSQTLQIFDQVLNIDQVLTQKGVPRSFVAQSIFIQQASPEVVATLVENALGYELIALNNLDVVEQMILKSKVDYAAHSGVYALVHKQLT
ncbi:MAG: hypothetical protein ACRC6X_06655, partial [Culicoidibacterales bacterium]